MSDFSSGNRVRVTSGDYKGRKGMIAAVDDSNRTARLHLTTFGEEAVVSLDCLRREYRHNEDAPPGASLTLSARRRIRMRKRYGLKP